MSYFQQKLPFSISAFDLLNQLQDLSGLVYLHDADHPVIGFLPEQYLIAQAHSQQCFTQTKCNQYHAETTAISLSEFCQFDQQRVITQEDLHFQGGYLGFIGYDYGTQQSVDTPTHPQPYFFLGRYSSFLKFQDGAWYFCSHAHNAETIFQLIQKHLHQSPETVAPLQLLRPCQARWSKAEYLQAFHTIQDYIKAGDCYQINLTQEFNTTAHGSLLSRAKDFWELTHAPYMGYLKIHDFELLSCSPELFIEFQSDRHIKTRPIKGTMPRFDDPKQDQHSKDQLRQSEKDQAENVMIVDLLRNDLSVYAETGSVQTTKLFEIESFNQVHHLVSEITATLKAEVNPMQMLLSALPGGSITGAPKIRAMQIIAELEGNPRGAYCGSLGYFNFDGTGRWNILIRSIQKYQLDVSVWAGGGITIASDPEAEYQECFDKISAILEMLNQSYES